MGKGFIKICRRNKIDKNGLTQNRTLNEKEVSKNCMNKIESKEKRDGVKSNHNSDDTKSEQTKYSIQREKKILTDLIKKLA